MWIAAGIGGKLQRVRFKTPRLVTEHCRNSCPARWVSVRNIQCDRSVFTAGNAIPSAHDSGNAAVYDIAVVGGGIVGLASARQLLQRHKHLRLVVLEREEELAIHQTGRNSGVVHAGMYYQPGSLRAKLCVKGHASALQYCDENNISCKRVGKLIVAVDEVERERLHQLFERGLANQVADIRLVGQKEMQLIAPGVSGLEAIWSPHTAIVDWRQVALSFARDVQSHPGCEIQIKFDLQQARYSHVQPLSQEERSVELWSRDGRCVRTRNVVTCAGVYADKVFALLSEGLGKGRGQHRSGVGSEEESNVEAESAKTGMDKVAKTDGMQVIPVRGSYWRLSPQAVKQGVVPLTNIYPVPDPRYPWLGVHFTPTIQGEILVGPNAALVLSKRAYSGNKLSEIDWRDCRAMLTHPGFLKFALKNWQFGLRELYYDQKPEALMSFLKRYIPALRQEHVLWHEPDRSRRSGIRAQVITRRGEPVDDFVFETSPRCLHVLNAPSPGATSSLAIAGVVADRVASELSLTEIC
eukprot:gb/GEZN01004048.1/.p1 GENE.gb/GEZN01004048.1/~~gb/GEZN01004048.1/.p1  ORF type:complete len:524 (-),score=46.54 gb/GEZN01004048.1/:419-1990(-)